MESDDTLLILVHDAWHGAWEWDGVVNRLTERGWAAVAFDLPAHGALYQVGSASPPPTLDVYAESVAAFVRNQPAPNVILVAHGTAGPICQRAYELLQTQPPHAKLAGIIFVSAFVLQDGEAMAAAFPPEMVEVFQQLASSRSDHSLAMSDLADYWRFNIMSDDVRRADEVLTRLTPEPLAPLFEKINLKTFFELKPPCAYLSFNEDNLLPPGSFYPRMASKLGHYRHASVNTGHEGPLTKPREVAESLIFLARSAFDPNA